MTRIERRRVAVKKLLRLRKSAQLGPNDRRRLAKRFGCRETSIAYDCQQLSRPKDLATPFTTPKRRRIVHQRDSNTCQYCGGATDIPTQNYIDHIIPVAHPFHGDQRFHNLVVACSVCNTVKGRYGKVWIPQNFDVITGGQPAYARRVLDLVSLHNGRDYRLRLPE